MGVRNEGVDMSQTRVVVLGENTFPFHKIDEKADAFREILAEFDVTVTTDRDVLTDEYDVLVDFLTDSTLTDAQREGLLDHVAAGGGYVGVHSASDLTSTVPDDPEDVIDHMEEPFPELRELIGGHFLNHPEQSEYGVDVVADHPITEGVEDFTVFDEPYQVDWDDHLTVLARMDHPDLTDYPTVWVNPAADGPVAYISPGHTDSTFETDEFRRLVRNAVAWAADGA